MVRGKGEKPRTRAQRGWGEEGRRLPVDPCDPWMALSLLSEESSEGRSRLMATLNAAEDTIKRSRSRSTV